MGLVDYGLERLCFYRNIMPRREEGSANLGGTRRQRHAATITIECTDEERDTLNRRPLWKFMRMKDKTHGK